MSGRRHAPRLTAEDRRRYVSIQVAAEFLGVHRRTLERWLEEDPPRISYRQDGPRQRVIDRASVMAYDASRRKEARAS